jgi:hypothetical protein
MSLRCGCPDASDDVVFGPCRKCSGEAARPRGWVFAVSQDDFTLLPPEPRYMDTLDEMERGGH